MPTPSTTRHSRALSPPLSHSSQAFTIGGPPKLNVVTRLAIEGKAKQSQDGIAIKMYLKISLLLEGVVPGTTIPLFPEENIKILTSQVHPLDNTSAPYNFSSTTCPLLHNAARALALPSRSSVSYLSNFGLSSTSTSSGSSSRQATSNGANIPPLDDKYTGHILVSGYNVSYVLPKEFPRLSGIPLMENEDDGSVRGNQFPSFKSRRSSFGEKNSIQFMAAIDMWVPYISRPPRAPYLLSIPIPRCLSNTMKLGIFPPTPTSASFASLSSAEDDGGIWDLTSDPHVTRSVSSRHLRQNSYSHFADDESSDSSTPGFPDGCGIQGTFPSADRIRLRWATPLKTVNISDGGDNRRRVGVKEATGDVTCIVLGKGRHETGGEGIIFNIQYKGTCKGVWFPGVATLLGMDVGLETKGSDVYWANESEQAWTVGGGVGYTGYGMFPPTTVGPMTDDTPQLFLLPSAPGQPGRNSRHNSNSSTSSLLRVPLPVQNVPDYSFEGSAPASTPSGTVSSLGSLPPTSTPNLEESGPSDDADTTVRPPGVPITIHINMNDLLPPQKNIFTFTISGTVLVVPRVRLHSLSSRDYSTQLESEVDTEPIVLPRFSVLAADTETITVLIRNDIDNANVEVFNSSGDIRDAQTRKTVLQKGGFTRCGTDGGRIALRSVRPIPILRHRAEESIENGKVPPPRPRTPSGVSSPFPMRQGYPPVLRPRRDGALMIPSVVATVTPLIDEDGGFPNAYGVRMALPAPCDGDSEWLEFGFAQPSSSSSPGPSQTGEESKMPACPCLSIACASIDGVPVRFESNAGVKQEENDLNGLATLVAEVGGKDWVNWVRVYVGGRGGGHVVVDYLVTERDGGVSEGKDRRGKERAKDEYHLEILLPTFLLPIGRMEVNMEINTDLEVTSFLSNFAHQHYYSRGRRLLHYLVEELFHPRLTMRYMIRGGPATSTYTKPLKLITIAAPTLLTLFLLFCLISLRSEIRQVAHSIETCSSVMGPSWDESPEPVTITTTVHASGNGKWWFGDATSTGAPSSATPSAPPNVWSPQSSPPYLSSAERSAGSPSTSGTRGENNELIPYVPWPLTWPFDFELPPPARAAIDKILEGWGVVWRVVIQVYHYPLDPPS